MYKHATVRESGGMLLPPTRKFLEFRGYEIASEIIFGAKRMLLGGQTTELYMHEHLPFLPVG